MDETFAETIAQLQTLTRQLNSTIASIAPAFSTGDKLMVDHFRTTRSVATRGQELLKGLPTDWTSARWILLHGSHGFRSTLFGCAGFLELLPEFFDLTAEQITFLQRAIPDAEAIQELFRPLEEQVRTFGESPEMHHKVGSPTAFLSEIICPSLHYHLQPDILTVEVDPEADLSPIVYTHRLTLNIFMSMMGIVTGWRFQTNFPLTIRVLADRASFEIIFRMRDFHLTPARWYEVEDRLEQMSYGADFRHFIGCDFAPLTWDEGEGQGFRVRLPWSGADWW